MTIVIVRVACNWMGQLGLVFMYSALAFTFFLFNGVITGIAICHFIMFSMLSFLFVNVFFFKFYVYEFCMQKLKKMDLKTTDEEKMQYSKYMLQMLLPFLKQFHEKQMIEKEVEAKIQGITFRDSNNLGLYF